MKQLLTKILPRFMVNLLIKNKYKKYNIDTHQKNIKNSRIIEITCNNKEKYEFLKHALKKSFGGIIKVDSYNFYFHPVAIIKTPSTIEEYLKLIGAKSRNMNKKADKNRIGCILFDWNEKLDDIYAINTSALYRQGREMDSAYREYPKKVENRDSEDFKIRYIGAFKEEQLIGYVELYVYGNFIMTNRILGDKRFLKYGLMNLLIKKCVEYAIENKIAFINYLSMQNRKNNSLSAFKYRVGFKEYSLLELQ